MKTLLKPFFAILINLVWFSGSAQTKVSDKDNVIAQMNYCMNILTNIINNKSIDVLEHESDQIINNLTMEQIVGLRDIRDFRSELLDAVGSFEITEEERNVIRRILSMRNDKSKWEAVSNAISSTMLLIPGGKSGESGVGMQLGFQALLTSARIIIEYKSLSYDQNIAELQAMWELRKKDMETINGLRKKTHSIIYNLYEKYGLNEKDRLTENIALLFNRCVTEPNPDKRIRLLQDNYNDFCNLTEYYYFLGMAFIDKGDYKSGKPYLDKYVQLYSKTPILRYNEKLGTIAMTKLTYDKQLSNTEKEQMIKVVLDNLKGNSAAILHCALIYISQLNAPNKAINIIRYGIDNPKATDPDLLINAAINFLPYYVNKPKEYRDIKNAIENKETINLDSYIDFYLNKNENSWSKIVSLFNFDDFWGRDWYGFKSNTTWTNWYGSERTWKNQSYLKDNFDLSFSNKFKYKRDAISLYLERYYDNALYIQELVSENNNVITQNKLDKISCFKHHKNLKYLFFEEVEKDVYRVKPFVNIEKIEDESFPRIGEFQLDENEIKTIVKFIKKHQEIKGIKLHIKPYETEEDITAKAIKTTIKIAGINKIFTVNNVNNAYINMGKAGKFEIKFKGETLKYQPYISPKLQGDFLRLVTSNGSEILYKYNRDRHKLSPYLYINGTDTIFSSEEIKKEYKTSFNLKK